MGDHLEEQEVTYRSNATNVSASLRYSINVKGNTF